MPTPPTDTFELTMRVPAEDRAILIDTLAQAAGDLDRYADRHPLKSQDPNTRRYRIKDVAGVIAGAVAQARNEAPEPELSARELAHRYADHLVNTGGNELDRLLGGATNALINLPLAVLEAAVQSQAHLLASLYQAGLLRAPAPADTGDNTRL